MGIKYQRLTPKEKLMFLKIIIKCLRFLRPELTDTDIQHICIFGYNKLYKKERI